MVKEIKLGDMVRCKVSGFKGIAVTKVFFINGCIQFEVQPRCGKDGKMIESEGIDIQSLEVIKTPAKKIIKKPTGGAMKKVPRMRGY